MSREHDTLRCTIGPDGIKTEIVTKSLIYVAYPDNLDPRDGLPFDAIRVNFNSGGIDGFHNRHWTPCYP